MSIRLQQGQKWIEETIKQLSSERMVPIQELSWSTEGRVYTINVVSSRSGKSEQESFPQKRIEECASAGTTGERWGMELNLNRMLQRLEAAEAGMRF